MKSLLTVAAVAVLAAGCSSMGGQQSGSGMSGAPRSAGVVVDDAAITAAIKSRLVADSELSALAINIDTRQGAVRLRGEVKTLALRRKAEEIARGVSGVKSVNNELVVTG